MKPTPASNNQYHLPEKNFIKIHNSDNKKNKDFNYLKIERDLELLKANQANVNLKTSLAAFVLFTSTAFLIYKSALQTTMDAFSRGIQLGQTMGSRQESPEPKIKAQSAPKSGSSNPNPEVQTLPQNDGAGKANSTTIAGTLSKWFLEQPVIEEPKLPQPPLLSPPLAISSSVPQSASLNPSKDILIAPSSMPSNQGEAEVVLAMMMAKEALQKEKPENSILNRALNAVFSKFYPFPSQTSEARSDQLSSLNQVKTSKQRSAEPEATPPSPTISIAPSMPQANDISGQSEVAPSTLEVAMFLSKNPKEPDDSIVSLVQKPIYSDEPPKPNDPVAYSLPQAPLFDLKEVKRAMLEQSVSNFLKQPTKAMILGHRITVQEAVVATAVVALAAVALKIFRSDNDQAKKQEPKIEDLA